MSDLLQTSFEHGRDLAKALGSGDLTPSQIASLPALQLYVALLSSGMENVADVLPFVTHTQYRLLLDFDFWERDCFLPDKFLLWLERIDEAESLELFEQFLRALPRDVLELATQAYVNVFISEEQSEPPDELGWFTPDLGRVWIRFLVTDETHLRHLGKFYAYLFQRSAELFYQLMLNLRSTTAMELEEESLLERQRRLMDVGMPDIDTQLQLQSPLTLREALRRLEAQNAVQPEVVANDAVQVIDSRMLQPFGQFMAQVSALNEPGRLESVLGELARILNTGLVVYRTALDDEDQLHLFHQQVRGLVNLGIEQIWDVSNAPAELIYQALSLQGLYRLGLDALAVVRAAGSAATLAACPLAPVQLEAIAECLQRPIPLYPRGALSDGDERDTKPYEHLTELEHTLRVLSA